MTHSVLSADVEKIKVKLKHSSGKETEGEVTLQTWNVPARSRRAMKWLFMIWGVGAFFVLIPIIHFIIPPLAIITGPVIAFLLSRQSSAVTGGSGACPSCGARFAIVRSNYLGVEDQWPIRDICASCREEATIERGA